MTSIIIPIYNASPYLRQCLNSLLAQTITDWEAILVDDASTDDSAVIAEDYIQQDSRFILFRQEFNQGQSIARNIGLEKVKGDYIIFLDADDYLDCDYLERHIEAIGDADYVQSGYKRIHINGEIQKQKLPHHRYQFVSPCMRLYRTSFLQQYHLSFPVGMIYEDVIFSLNVWGVAQRIVFIRYTGYNYTTNPMSTTFQAPHNAKKVLMRSILLQPVPLWLKWYTIWRLLWHFAK